MYPAYDGKLPNFALNALAKGTVLGVMALSGPANIMNMMHSAEPLVSFQKVAFVAWEAMPIIGMGTCLDAHCTVGCTPTWLIPVTITSGFSPSILLKIGVKSVVSGENRMW